MWLQVLTYFTVWTITADQIQQCLKDSKVFRDRLRTFPLVFFCSSLYISGKSEQTEVRSWTKEVGLYLKQSLERRGRECAERCTGIRAGRMLTQPLYFHPSRFRKLKTAFPRFLCSQGSHANQVHQLHTVLRFRKVEMRSSFWCLCASCCFQPRL